MPKVKVRHAERIKWVDSHSPGGQVWVEADDICPDIMAMVSVGYVYAEDDDQVTLVSSYDTGPNGDQWSGVITIPKVAITERKRLVLGAN
jgi:hypothetical protein